MPRTVAIIPARGGSKGILRKNIKHLAGKPLIYYSIKAAQDATSIDEVYVSTEDKQVAEIAESFGAKVIHRPIELADGIASTFSVLHHAFHKLDSPDIVVVLQPTSPLRTAEDIDNAFSLLTDDVAAIVGVCEFHGYLWNEKKDVGQPLFKERLPRQKMGRQYVENGSLYITRKEVYINNDSRLGMGIPSNSIIKLYVMDKKHGVELDSEEDLVIIESLFRREYGDYKNTR